MKTAVFRLVVVLSLVFPFLALAGSFEDMEAAFKRGDESAVIELIDRGFDPNSVDRSGNTLLIRSIRAEMPKVFDYLLQHKARVNLRNKNGETALSLLAFLGDSERIKRLLSAGAEVNSFGWHPLSYAAFNGHVSVIEILLKAGADVNAPTQDGSTAIFYAARNGHQRAVSVLLANSADPDVVNEKEETAVDWAIKGGNTDIEALLRTAGGRSGKSVTIDVSK